MLKTLVLRVIFVFPFFTSLCADDASLSDHFHICTVASEKHANLDKLISSCIKHKIDLEILGLNQPYYGNGTKLLRLNEYINTLPDDDIVMFVDAYDVLIVHDKEVILNKFIDMKAPFVMSAEKNCFPFVRLANNYPKTSSPFKFINSGGFIGYVHNLKAWLAELCPINPQKGDQGQITIHYLKNQSTFIIDNYCELFLSLSKVGKKEIAIDETDRVVRCLTTGSEPSVIHANGKSFYLWNIIYEKLVVN